jgi:prophage maintenance system killer protein
MNELRFLDAAAIDARYAIPRPREPIGGDVLFVQRLHAFEGVSDLVELAAALLVRVNKHHPLHDGNKRASITLCDEFLRLNGHHVAGPPDELAAFVWGIAAELGSAPEDAVRARALERLRAFVEPGAPDEPFAERYPEVMENLAS